MLSYLFMLRPRRLLTFEKIIAVSCNSQNSFSFKSKTKDHYEILNLSRTCSSKEIREAFISLSKQYHPDKNKDNPKAQEQFVQVNEAYNVLIKPESRKNYDCTLSYYGDPSRAYQSSDQGNFYKVRRHDEQEYYREYYRDPWKDPSFAANRKFYSDGKDDPYGFKGTKKFSDATVMKWIMIIVGVLFGIQIILIRFTHMRNIGAINRNSEENRLHLEAVRARANSFETLDEQIEDTKRRLNHKEDR